MSPVAFQHVHTTSSLSCYRDVTQQFMKKATQTGIFWSVYGVYPPGIDNAAPFTIVFLTRDHDAGLTSEENMLRVFPTLEGILFHDIDIVSAWDLSHNTSALRRLWRITGQSSL